VASPKDLEPLVDAFRIVSNFKEAPNKLHIVVTQTRFEGAPGKPNQVEEYGPTAHEGFQVAACDRPRKDLGKPLEKDLLAACPSEKRFGLADSGVP
jgi:hypothetical protein